MKDERAAKEAVEASAAEAAAEAERLVAAARSAAAGELQEEVEARRKLDEELAAVRGQLGAATTATEAAKAQLQAYQITADQKRAGLLKEKVDIEVRLCVPGRRKLCV